MTAKKHGGMRLSKRPVALDSPVRIAAAILRLVRATRHAVIPEAVDPNGEKQWELERARTWARWVWQGMKEKRSYPQRSRENVAKNLAKVNEERKRRKEERLRLAALRERPTMGGHVDAV
jgi:hypothetical protein